MTKAETHEIEKSLQFAAAGMGPDYLARVLSALYRATRSKATKLEILVLAAEHNITNNPEFIV